MKTIIYLRTSTKEQFPELQEEECINFCKEKNLEIVEIIKEQGSAFKKGSKRLEWERVTNKAKKEKLNIVLWRYDRAFRNRKEFYKFMKVMFEVYNVKIYSVKETSILSFWEMLDKSYSDNPIFNELFNQILQAFWNFLIQQAGEQAEEESNKKSQRVKLAVRKDSKGKTISYKGNKWGRKGLTKNTINEVLKLHKEGLSMRQISKQVYYWDKNNNKKKIGVTSVHKIISQNKD